MKRIYTALCGIVLFGMLLVGLISTFDKDATFSDAENRKLKTKPKLTISGLLDGSYTEEYRAYYADTFPTREKLMKSNVTLNNFYYFSFLGKDSTQLVVNFDTNAAQHGESLKDPEATTGTQDPSEGTTSTEPTEKVPTQTEPAGKAEQLGAVVLIGDSAFDVPTADSSRIAQYAAAVTKIAETLGEDVQTISMPVPNSAEFYTKKEHHTGSHSQIAMFDLCRENISRKTFMMRSEVWNIWESGLNGVTPVIGFD